MLRVGLLFGSRSVEHEVSVTTAAKVFEVFGGLRGRFEAVPIYIAKSGVWLMGPAVRELLILDGKVRAGPRAEDRAQAMEGFRRVLAGLARSGGGPEAEQLFLAPDPSVRAFARDPEKASLFRRRLQPRVDLVFPLLHGTHGEDGTVQGLLELADLPYVGAGVAASAVGMDKILSKRIFRGAGLPVLDWVGLTRRQVLEDEAGAVRAVEASLTYPLVVKPAVAGSSVGIAKASDRRELQAALQRAMRFSSRVLAEPAVQDCREVQCALLGNHALTVSAFEELIRGGDIVGFEQKYLRREDQAADLAPSRIPAPLPEGLARELAAMAQAAFRALDGRGIGRVDFLLDAATLTPYVNEINTLPGSLCLRLWEASGIKPADLIQRLVELALEAHREKEATRFESEEGELLVDRKHLMIPGK